MWDQVSLAVMPEVEKHLGVLLSFPLGLGMGDSVDEKITSPPSLLLDGFLFWGALISLKTHSFKKQVRYLYSPNSSQ